jgi:hypothetical protein
MKLSKITNVDTIRSIDNATELFQNEKYNSKDHVEKFIGLMIHRSGFYGRLTGDTILPLNRIDTTFNESTDVVILIEGYVSLAKEPVNNGLGGIVYEGYGTLVVGGGIKYGGSIGGSEIIDSENGDFAPVDASGVTYRMNSVSDINVTINEDTCPVGHCVSFTQVGAGQIVLLEGDITFEIDVYTSVKTAGQGSTITVFHAAPGIYNIYGQTE